MNLLMYLSNETLFLAERWLRMHRNEENVSVIVSNSLIALADKLKKTYPNISNIFILPEGINQKDRKVTILREKIIALSINRVVIPLSMKTIDLRFVEATIMPDFKPFYSLFRMFWLLGIREFEVFSLNGTQSFTIPHLLDEFVGIHEGKRCFIVGNGPSLNKIDMSLLKNEITFGQNRCYLGYEKWGFPFTYYCLADRLQVEEYFKEYEDNIPKKSIKFFPFEYLPFLRFENICPFNFLFDFNNFPQFSDSCDKIYLGNTTTYILIQIASVMGCNPIILIGTDHRYQLKEEEKTHVNSEYDLETEEKIIDIYKIASSFQNLGYFDDGKKWFNNVLKKTKDKELIAGAYFHLGEIYYLKGDFKNAENMFKKCLKNLPLHKKASDYLGLMGISFFEDSLEDSKQNVSSTQDRGNDFWVATDATEPTHFDGRYSAGKKRFIRPRPERAERAFECAARWAEAKGVKILNATPGTELTAFPLVSYESLFCK